MSDKLSKHFRRSEFECQCGCGFDTVDVYLLEMLERIREHFAAPVTINSGCRCPSHNASIGGAPSSQHVKGRAADIVVKGFPASLVQEWIEDNIDPPGLGKYNSFTHIDSRTGKSRWRG